MAIGWDRALRAHAARRLNDCRSWLVDRQDCFRDAVTLCRAHPSGFECPCPSEGACHCAPPPPFDGTEAQFWALNMGFDRCAEQVSRCDYFLAGLLRQLLLAVLSLAPAAPQQLVATDTGWTEPLSPGQQVTRHPAVLRGPTAHLSRVQSREGVPVTARAPGAPATA